MEKKPVLIYIGGRKLGELGKKIISKYKKYFTILYEFPEGDMKVDYLFNLFGEKIFSKAQLDRVKIGSINFHFGHLPKYRGRFIVSHLIANGEKKSCVTCHYMDKGVDTGDIIYEVPVIITPTETAYTLFTKCSDIGATLFETVIKMIISGRALPRKKQTGKSHYYPKGQLNGDRVDLRWSKNNIENFIRATTFPPFYPHMIINNEKYLIVKDEYYKITTK